MATIADGCRLMEEGCQALAVIEEAGMRIDMDRLDWTISETSQQIEQMMAEQKKDDVWRLWRRRFGEKASMGSRSQLAKILFSLEKDGGLGFEHRGHTRLGKQARMDEDVLEQIDHPFVKQFLKLEGLKKLRSTYLMGVRREVVDGLLHPSFNLHLVRTYRSSSDHPNFQNIPIRDKEIGKLIRSCFVPRPGHVLVESDYGSLEVRVSACYNHDPMLIEYINDPTKDMHRDMAAECYMIEPHEVSKEARFYAKNQFVFPEFYGSYFAQCAPNLWNAIGRYNLKTTDGQSLEDVLLAQGITSLGETFSHYSGRIETKPGTFMEHIRQVEEDFWGRRFKVYAKWKLDWFREYQRTGGFSMLTGFRVDGVYKRNDVINYPVQGSAFHCLLWSLIQLVKWLRRNRMKTVVVGQIHDSIVADVHEDELQDYLAMTRQIMLKDIRREWPWIIVPLEVEQEVAETNWFEKKKVA
jgi:DNA polymerase-1